MEAHAAAKRRRWYERWARAESVAVIVAAGLLAASFVYVPGRMPPVSRCLMSEVLGIPCPLCGMTRSFCSLARGQWADSFVYHPLGPVVFAMCVGIVILGLRDVLIGRYLLRRVSSRIHFENPWPYIGAFALLWSSKLAAVGIFGL
jgi:hypothetical protein